ncbi:MAG: DUF1320 domain-containing protein [Pseudomonadota bacterium]
MTYASFSDLATAYGNDELVRLTDRDDLPTGAVDMAVIEKALGDAGALIDGYLGARYVLPLTITSDLLRGLAEVIALYKLHRFGAPESVRTDYEDALKTLAQIANGNVRIPGAAGVEPDGTGASGARVTDRDRPFTADNMRSFI